MSYSIVLTRNMDKDRAFGDNLYLDNLPNDSDVFIFYYPSMRSNDELKSRLKEFGKAAGNDIFVNIGKIGDKDYKKMVNDFDIRLLPVVIITGKDTVASLRSGDSSFKPGANDVTAYVRLDNKRLFEDVDKIMESIGEIFNLFISRRIVEALDRSKGLQRSAILLKIKDIIGTLKYVEEISVGLLPGSFSIKFRGS